MADPGRRQRVGHERLVGAVGDLQHHVRVVARPETLVEMVTYPGTGHAFFWPGTPEFRPKARDDAWARILALLAG